MGGKPRARSTSRPPLQRTRVKLDFVVQHRGPSIVLRANWLDVIAVGIRRIGIPEAECIEPGTRISVSVAPRKQR